MSMLSVVLKRLPMRKITPFALVGILAAAALTLSIKTQNLEIKNVTPTASAKSSSDLPTGAVKEYEIQPGDTFAEVMTENGVPYYEVMSIMKAAQDVFDFTKIGAGKVLTFVFVSEAFAAVEYPLDSESVIHVKKDAEAFVVQKEEIMYDIQEVTSSGTITSSLFLAAADVGIEDKVIMELAGVFSSDIDFATDIRDGDSFSVIYEKRILDGEDAGAGKILAAKFTSSGSTYTAFRYKDKFYDTDGNSVARQFLKSPLHYAYISSGFSYKRTNPVTKQVTPHRAIDYAADAGTPVIATADGKVTTAGSKGGLGVTVELRHGNYLTQYAHLSRIAKGIENGTEVDQGDVIGYVGSTGISTGPHLQYAMFKNGSPINPLNTNFSRTEPIPDAEKETFTIIRDKMASRLQ